MPASLASNPLVHLELQPCEVDEAVELYGVAAILPSRLSRRWVTTLARGTSLLLDESAHVPMPTNLQQAALTYVRHILKALAEERSPALCTAVSIEFDAAEMGVQIMNSALRAEADRRSAGQASDPHPDALLLEQLRLTLPLWHDQIA